MKQRCLLVFASLALVLVIGACAGGGEDDEGGVQVPVAPEPMPDPDAVPPESTPDPDPVPPDPNAALPVSITGGTMPPADLPVLESGDSGHYPAFVTGKMATFNTPISQDQRIFLGIDQAIHIGPDVSTESRSGTDQRINGLRSLSSITHGDAMIIHGRATDDASVDKYTLRSYLYRDAYEFDTNGYIARFGNAPPVVHIAQGASPEMVSDTIYAVQLLNAELPLDWQIGVSSSRDK